MCFLHLLPILLFVTLFGCASPPEAARLQLSNPNATKEAADVFRYIVEGKGRRTLTGQQESRSNPGGPSPEVVYIERNTGKLPAIIGLDYMEPREHTAVNIRAEKWYKEGGIVTICWHWGAPDIGSGYLNAKKFFDLEAALRDGTPQNLAMMRDMDLVADQLAVLRDKGIPVLWRPLHEFSGNWFWWGMSGPENFKKLWIKMYNYYTVTKGLNNLVWVLGFTGQPDARFYPGDAYVDIAGADRYAQDHSSLKPLYDKMVSIAGTTRPIALHENGPIPDPDLVIRDGAQWAYFMTWGKEYLFNPKWNSVGDLQKAYGHPFYVTKDALPKWSVEK